MNQRIALLGVPIDAITRGEAAKHIHVLLNRTTQHHVATPNSEMLVAAWKNPAFHALLNRTALNLPDSAGLLAAARWTRQSLPERVTGVDTVWELCRTLSSDHPVFLLGAAPGVAERAAARLRAMNSNLTICGTWAGSPDSAFSDSITQRIREDRPHLLLVAFGSPAQDLWIDQFLKNLPTVRVAIGVGGTFDFLAGVAARAPLWMQRWGLEWLWRLTREPKRIRRIINAVIVFPWLVLWHGKNAPRSTR